MLRLSLIGLGAGWLAGQRLFAQNATGLEPISLLFENFAAAAKPGCGIKEIRTLGYYASGDGGGANYCRTQPPAPDAKCPSALRCADGSAWEIAECEITPLMFGAHPKREDASDDSDAFQDAFRYAAQNGKGIYVPPGYYAIAKTISVQPKPIPDPDYQYLKPGPTYRFDKQAILTATAPMEALIQFGEGNWETIHRNSTLIGGIFDCNKLAKAGVWLKFFKEFKVDDVDVRNFPLHAFRAGWKKAPQRSGGAFFSKCTTWRDPVPAPENSCSIFFENAGDSHATNCMLCGCAIGIGGVNVWDCKFTSVHVWNTEENGALHFGFDCDGDDVLSGCQVDGPFEYAYHFKNLRNTLQGCNTNNGDYGAQDLRGVVIKIEKGGGVTAMNCNWKAVKVNPIRAEAEGDLSHFEAIGNKYSNVMEHPG